MVHGRGVPVVVKSTDYNPEPVMVIDADPTTTEIIVHDFPDRD